jgi:hypothetical protein
VVIENIVMEDVKKDPLSINLVDISFKLELEYNLKDLVHENQEKGCQNQGTRKRAQAKKKGHGNH